MSNYVLPVSSLPKYQLDRPQQDAISVLVGAGGIATLRRRVDR